MRKAKDLDDDYLDPESKNGEGGVTISRIVDKDYFNPDDDKFEKEDQ